MVDRRSLETLATIFEREELVEPELRTYPLDRAAAALEVVGTGHVRGKIVVLP